MIQYKRNVYRILLDYKRFLLLAACMLFGALACVTVNVNFPESAVQKATDDYVRELYRAKEKGRSSSPEAPTPAASTQPSTKDKTENKSSVLPFSFIQTVWAGDLVFRVDSDKAYTIQDNLRKRLSDVLAYKRAGVLGESNDGLLVLKNPDKSKKLLVKKLEKLVSDENDDREDLYSEVVSENQLPKNRLKDVKRSFARSFQAESPSKTWVQDSEGKWSQKP